MKCFATVASTVFNILFNRFHRRLKVFIFSRLGPKCSLFTQMILWRKPRVWQSSNLSISINECAMNVEATAETERLHTVRLWIYSTLPKEYALSMRVGAFNTHCTTHTDVFKSTQNTSQKCKKVDNCRNLHRTFDIYLSVWLKCNGHLKTMHSHTNKISHAPYGFLINMGWHRCSWIHSTFKNALLSQLYMTFRVTLFTIMFCFGSLYVYLSSLLWKKLSVTMKAIVYIVHPVHQTLYTITPLAR